MKTYRATFSLVGSCTKLPEAQTLFGAFCQSIRIQFGEEMLNDYLQSFSANPWFVHSSMFPEDLFPAPKQSILTLQQIQEIADQREPSIKLFILSQVKRFKKFHYVEKELFDKYVLKDQIRLLGSKCIRTEVDIDTSSGISVLKTKHANADENRNSLECKSILQTRSGSLENKREKELFYQNQLYFSKSSRFNIYLKSNIVESLLRKILSGIELTGVGGDISVGLNQFHLERIDEIHSESSRGRVCLLSPCFADLTQFNFSQSDYAIQSSTYRTSYSYVRNGMAGRFALLQVGSMMQTNQKKEFYGSLLPVKVKGKTLYHYGIGFVL